MSFQQAMKRPANYHYLDPETQWDIDKSLGILDWDGDMTPEQKKQYEQRFFKKEKKHVD